MANGTQNATSVGSWQAPKPAFGYVTMEEMQRLAKSSASFPSQGQAAKPAFGAVTMEEMLRLVNANAPMPSQAPPTVSASATQAFGSVTIEDVQRLASANASVSFPPQTAPATESGAQAASGTQNASQSAWQTPRPAFGAASLEDVMCLANANAAMSSQASRWPSQAPTTPAFENVTLEDMVRLATTSASSFPSHGASASFPSQTAPIPKASGTQAAPQSATSNTSSWQPPQPAFANLTMADFQRLSSTCTSTNFPSPTAPIAKANGTQAAPQSATSNTSPWQTPKHAFGNSTMEDFQRLASASASASFHTQTAPTTTESDVQAAPPSTTSNTSSWKTPKPALGKFTTEEFQSLANFDVSAAPSAQAASTVSENESQNVSSSKAWKPSVRSVMLEEMQRRANADVPLASQPTPTALANETQDTSLNVAFTSVEKMDSSDSSLFSSQTWSENGNEPVFDDKPPPQKVSGGHLQRFLSSSNNNNTASQPSGTKNMAWPDPNSNKGLPSEQPNVPLDLSADAMLKNLQDTMKNSLKTQKALEEFDKERGLPRSHSQTMVNSSRSRKQLQEGKIIAKWDGSPLISPETELGKPKLRALSKKSGTT
jgi:hypothetical protein